MAKDQSWIADLLAGYKEVNLGGVPLPRRNTLNLVSGFSAVDNPSGAAGAGSTDLAALIPGVWTTLLDLDFTAQSNATFATDTTYTIGGLTWTKENSASETVQHAAIVAGTGLVFNASNFSGNGYHSATRTAPLVRLPLTTLFGSNGFDWSTKLRIYVGEGTPTVTIGDAGSYNFVGLDSDSTALYTIASRGNKDSAVFCVESYAGAQVLGPFGSSGTFGSGNQTWMVELSALAMPPWRMHFQGPLSAGASFPALSTFQAGGAQAPAVDAFAAGKLPSDLGLVLGSAAPALVTTQFVFQRLRVDCLQG